LLLATAEKVEAAILMQKDGESALLYAMNLQLLSLIELVELDNGEENKAEEYIELCNNLVAVQAAMSRTYLERASTSKNLLSDIRILSRILFWDIKIPFTAGLLR
jgi:hypothetical protein